jgi:hypothetical protein
VIVQVQARLAALKQEYQAGEEQLRDLARREVALRETMLRIAGAIMVLEEVLSTAPETGAAPETATPDTAGTAVPDTAVPDAAVPDTAVPGPGPAAAGRGPHRDGQPAVLTVP